jgi:hypothetical protein
MNPLLLLIFVALNSVCYHLATKVFGMIGNFELQIWVAALSYFLGIILSAFEYP